MNRDSVSRLVVMPIRCGDIAVNAPTAQALAVPATRNASRNANSVVKTPSPACATMTRCMKG